jgi:hypothetical protein
MYQLNCHKSNILLTIEYVRANIKLFLLHHTGDIEKRNICLTGELNYVWNEWNEFWRYFWIAIFKGSFGTVDSTNIQKMTNHNESDVLFYIQKHLLEGKTSLVGVLPSYKEKTWGDKQVIVDIAIKLRSLNTTNINAELAFFDTGHSSSIIENYFHSIVDYVISIFGCYGSEVKRLQDVRNYAIHLNQSTFDKMKTQVCPFYSLPISSIGHPCDLLAATSLTSNDFVYDLWLDDMKAIIELI